LFEPTTRVPCLVAGLLAFTMGGMTTFVSVDAAQRPIGDPALFFVLYAVVLLITRPIAGLISDHRGRGQVLAPAVALTTAGLLALGSLSGPLSLPVAAVLYGLGFGAAQPTLQALVVDRVPPARRGAAMAAFYIAFDLGVGLGTILFGVIGGIAGLPMTFQLAAGLAVVTLGVVIGTRLHQA
jgi:MFS family permease